jgi:hypothetical protein
MIPFAADLEGMVATRDFGQAATWTPAGGSAAAVTVILDEPHTPALAETGVGVLAQGFRAFGRAADLGAAPKGGTLAIGSRSWTVKKAELDQTGALWTLELEPTF